MKPGKRGTNKAKTKLLISGRKPFEKIAFQYKSAKVLVFPPKIRTANLSLNIIGATQNAAQIVPTNTKSSIRNGICLASLARKLTLISALLTAKNLPF
jgi:hypothetical protein